MIQSLIILLLLNLIMVELIDRQNIPNKITSFISRKLTNNSITFVEAPKPFSCSYCMTFWTTLIYLLCVVPTFSILWLVVAISISLLNAIYTKLTYYILIILEAIIDKTFSKIYNKLKL